MISNAPFRSEVLRVMSPARFRCATFCWIVRHEFDSRHESQLTLDRLCDNLWLKIWVKHIWYTRNVGSSALAAPLPLLHTFNSCVLHNTILNLESSSWFRQRNEGSPTITGIFRQDSIAIINGNHTTFIDRCKTFGPTLEFCDYRLPWKMSRSCLRTYVLMAITIPFPSFLASCVEEWYSMGYDR